MIARRRPKAIRGESPASDAAALDSDSAMRDLPTGEVEDSDSLSGPDAEEDKDHTKQESEPDTSSTPEDETDAAHISFGALVRAQASIHNEDISKKRKRPSTFDDLPTHTSPHFHNTDTNDHNAEALERKAGKNDDRKHTRLSKHAPTELSSKKAVSRKRSVIPVPKREVRDPRFESVLGPINEQKIKSNYAFLDNYRDSEIKELKEATRKTKSEEEKERLKREVLRMESKRKAQQRKDAEQEVLRKHRKEERAKVEGGKTPFYLKRADVRKEALVERFKGMKKKEVDKLVERRRKKKASREKRSMPGERRQFVAG